MGNHNHLELDWKGGKRIRIHKHLPMTSPTLWRVHPKPPLHASEGTHIGLAHLVKAQPIPDQSARRVQPRGDVAWRWMVEGQWGTDQGLRVAACTCSQALLGPQEKGSDAAMFGCADMFVEASKLKPKQEWRHGKSAPRSRQSYACITF